MQKHFSDNYCSKAQGYLLDTLLTLPIVEKSRQKTEKAQKFAAKQSKVQLPPKAKPKENKTREKSQDTKLSEYIDETPKGQKKCEQISIMKGL